MKQLLSVVMVLVVLASCKNGSNEKNDDSSEPEYREVTNEGYSLITPIKKAGAVLVLFGGYPEKAEDIKREFKILAAAKENGIGVLFMNYSQKLWLEQSEKAQLAEQLKTIFEENELPVENVYIGGFSSGGIVTLLIGDFITENSNYGIVPKGLFIVDSPIDLAELYLASEKNLERNFSEPSVQESTWLIETLGQKFGHPNEDISKYQESSVFTLRTRSILNLQNLRNTKIRLYTEPDTLWWKQNRMADYEQMNAYHIKNLAEILEKQGYNSVEYIPTVNRGYRANGERHPHSWAIVDQSGLVNWMLEK
ncbi:MAG: hypothetical protein ABJP45_14830 [Cyclobacteriaceae bacterium]